MTLLGTECCPFIDSSAGAKFSSLLLAIRMERTVSPKSGYETRSRAITLTTIKGPISDHLLRCICDLYGKWVDERYRDLAFVRTLFNDNPFGYSYHVFAFDGPCPVGCYSIIPMEVISRGTPIVAGKGEALFLLEEYRAGPPGENHGNLSHQLAGLSLITHAHSFASQQGIELLFALSPEALWPILRATGFSKVHAQLKHRYFLLRPQIVRQLRSDLFKLGGACAASLAQQALFRLGCLFLPVGEHITKSGDQVAERQLTAISSRHVIENDRWSVACTTKALHWWLRMGYLQLLALDHNQNEYVLVSSGGRGGNLEILDWNLQGAGLVRALTVLRHVVALAREHGAATVSFADRPELTNGSVLNRAATLFGFLPWSVERVMFIKSPNRFHSEQQNLYFNWLFSI
jgi:hypothetical protein